nr:uncharacterized protein CTRU02_08793 [Colletotrichum truncatum]KAF6789546.1 hypothetical protein CTRU02_08793 [Colletotrichum truncatum]
MDKVKIPPLKTLTLKSRPLTSHALAFSCDAELAVAADDSVHVFLPEFPSAEEPSAPTPAPAADDNALAAESGPASVLAAAAAAAKNGEKISRQQYYTYILRIPTSRKPDPRMNAALFAAQGITVPSYDDDWAASGGDDPASAFEGVGSGTVTGYGASLNQVVAVEWSPSGVGRNLRAVLAVMLTNGALIVIGEGDGGGAIDLGARMRNFRDWRILWGIGANIPLPDANSDDGAYLPKDKIRSFAWARRIETGRAMLAYSTDEEEVVVLSIQYYLPSGKDDSSDAGSYVWEVEEVARFDGRGPHPTPGIMDPDYVPYTSAFSVKWSPWLLTESTRTAIISYCARNYVGFRRITIPRDWNRGEGLEVCLEETDLTGFCAHLASDAFVEWEDAVWDRDEAKVCRGVIASPFKALPFQVALNAPQGTAKEGHDTSVCGTTYPKDTTSLDATNPISGKFLVYFSIFSPDMSKPTKAPSYSLVRLSATATNDNWFQQNAAEASSDALPKWAETISSTVKLSVPVAMLGRGGTAAVGDAESVASDSSDSDDDDFDLPEDAGEQIHPYRVRLWGLTVSPAGGVSAVLMSQHSTQQPEKSIKTRVMFGGQVMASAPSSADQMDVDGDDRRRERPPFWDHLSTEAKMWDWMYGAGPAVPGTLVSDGDASVRDVSLKENLQEVKVKQRCVFCQTSLRELGKESICEMGHIFATCAATGLAILAPGISRACAVCGLRCLVAKEVVKIAQEHLGPDAKIDASEQVCGGCGGKFVV